MNTPTVMIDLGKIDVPDNRLRDADPERVDELAVSFTEIGQQQPIQVLPGDHGRFVLNFGLHRYLAAERAGFTQIEAKLFDGSAAEARLREIDENLYRAELIPYDQAAFLAERRVIYEALNGPVKAGRRNSDKLSQLSFFDDVTGKFGLPKRMVQRALRRKGRIAPAVWEKLRGTPIAKNASQLDALAKLVPFEQGQVADLLLLGDAKNVVDALRIARGVVAEIDPDQQQLQRLASAWAKAGSKARRQFLEFLRKTQEARETTPRKERA